MAADLERALNADTDPEDLGRLASSSDSAVRDAVLNNPSTPTWAKRQALVGQPGSGEANAPRAGSAGAVRPVAVRPQASSIVVVTTPSVPGYEVQRIVGPIAAARSHTKWKATSQYSRLKIALDGSLEELRQEASRVGANAVVGLSMSANSSSGGSEIFGGASDAIVLLGTAVVIRPQAMPAAEPERAQYPSCLEFIRRGAVRCPHCTSAIGDA